MSFICSQESCDDPAVNAVVNVFGFIHFRCSGHLGAPSTKAVGKLLTIGKDGYEKASEIGRRTRAGSDSVEISLEEALVLSVMFA